MNALFQILVFPGFIFLTAFGLFAQYIDRKIHARLQNRIGPPWFQPPADLIKLLAKEDIVPTEANAAIFKTAPLVALTSAVIPVFYIPLWKTEASFSFSGDLIAVLYLLTIPTLAFFIGGWYSTSLYARIGSTRAITQLLAYEVPLLMGILTPAILADSWSISEITRFYSEHPLYCCFNVIGFGVSFVALLGKLEKTPFDIPEAETEIVAGGFTEYSGRLLAFLRTTLDIEMVVIPCLLAAVFLPFGLSLNPLIGFLLLIVKVLFIVALLSVARTIFARLRIDQMVAFCWKYLTPVAIVQILINLFLKMILYR
jgi:NADH-quinone oxidoreductase subunit H